MGSRFGSVRPVIWEQVSIGLLCCAAFIFQVKLAFAPDIDYGWIALMLGGTYVARVKARP